MKRLESFIVGAVLALAIGALAFVVIHRPSSGTTESYTAPESLQEGQLQDSYKRLDQLLFDYNVGLRDHTPVDPTDLLVVSSDLSIALNKNPLANPAEILGRLQQVVDLLDGKAFADPTNRDRLSRVKINLDQRSTAHPNNLAKLY